MTGTAFPLWLHNTGPLSDDHPRTMGTSKLLGLFLASAGSYVSASAQAKPRAGALLVWRGGGGSVGAGPRPVGSRTHEAPGTDGGVEALTAPLRRRGEGKGMPLSADIQKPQIRLDSELSPAWRAVGLNWGSEEAPPITSEAKSNGGREELLDETTGTTRRP